MPQPTTVNIINYSPVHYQAFRDLNLEWLESYGLLEDHDVQVLNDPEGIILDRGGAIFLAEADGQIVGSAALMKEADGHYELAKMAVAPAHRGKGISRQLMEKCLEQARTLGAKRISLFSNHQLTTAIALYEKFGFSHTAVENSPFETADVRMERFL